MKDSEIGIAIKIMRRISRDWMTPYVTMLSQETHDPFLVLISTLLSLRTRDAATEAASRRLFALADTPQTMLQLTPAQIEQAIHPVLYYNVKTRNILKICRILVEQYDAAVPSDLETLDTLPGVGRKTANLVVTLGFHRLGLCVDTHVHRITNRWGYVHTRTPDETEIALRAKLPKRYWIEINSELVAFGQNICLPTSPLCSACPLTAYCERVGVTRHR